MHHSPQSSKCSASRSYTLDDRLRAVGTVTGTEALDATPILSSINGLMQRMLKAREL
jgi:hypothetical protein